MSLSHTKSVKDILYGLHTSTLGLSTAEAAERLQRHGPNELQESISRPAWKMLLAQFIEPMILILIAAAVLSFSLGNVTEGSAILSIVGMFGILGFIQEYRAEKAMAALKQLSSPTVRVKRDGELREISAHDLVPGDMVVLEAGNVVPADLRVIESVNLGILEAALTGESETVLKQTEPLEEKNLALGDRTNLAWMGTVVVNGRGTGVVIQTGMKTELGKIAGVIQNIPEGRTPLQKKLSRVGRDLSLAGLASAMAILSISLVGGHGFGESLLTAASLLVAVVPEGLPAVITATLALGGRRMLKRNALIRTLPAVETLGAVTVICSDKTGTLTENRMTVTQLCTLHHEMVLEPNPDKMVILQGDEPPETDPLLLTAALCNDGHLVFTRPGMPPHAIGDPTETALLQAAERFNLATMQLAGELPRVGEFPFDSARKRMSTLHRADPTDYPLPDAMKAPILAAVKGSPDSLLPRATHVLDEGRVVPITDGVRLYFQAVNERMAKEGLRVLGFAFRTFGTMPFCGADASVVEQQLVFCGLTGLIDPPRQAVRSSIACSHEAGIRTIMITGDHPLTAMAIARELGLASSGEEPTVMTGMELAALTDRELRHACKQVSVYARVSPEDKLRIVKALQENGQVVAMTGDGINDSPALKRAEIGVAMGITGTDVAKESAKMILLDDNFATIVSAIEEGRIIYDNLVRFIKYSFGGNLGKVLVMLFAPLFGLGAIALRPLHLLWLNLLTDGLMGLGLGLEAAETDVMKRPPRQPEANILSRPTIWHVGWMGVFICVTSLALAVAWFHLPCVGMKAKWQTILFSAIGFAQIGQAWGLRALTTRPFRFERNPALMGLTLVTLALQLSVIYIKPLAQAFHLQPLGWQGLLATAALGGVTFVVVHLERRRHCKK
ncbi:MAG: cation-translocating P-type ATPase [Verrucomicrobiota bacterium]|jgi:Ca2+-transporting ATPase|nr:cation-translocating P-type ATPase [Verrucomicrobiota bacterium]